MDDEPYEPTFVRCTPARRAALAAAKDLLAEAYLAREAKNIPAYAQALADLDRALIDMSADFGKPRTDAKDSGWIAALRDQERLDFLARNSAAILDHKENIVRNGFEVELTSRDLPVKWV